MPRVLIAAGGTAGHVVPALAVADALRAEGAQVAFAGGERAEAQLVPAAGYELARVPARGISRTSRLDALRALGTAARGVLAAWRLLGRSRPDAVLGAGGYVAGVVGIAAVLRRVPLVLAEADSHLGLANRLLARFARRVCLAFPIAGRDAPAYLLTGRPVPPPATDREAARRRWGIAPGEQLVLVFGGSLGARTINEAAVEAFADAPFRVLHAAGARDFGRLTAPGPHYELREYIADGFGEALLASDLVVARAGGSLFEIAAHGRPALLVPYPHAAGGHQDSNAGWMAGAGAAVVIPDAELTSERLAAEVGTLLSDPSRLAAMGRASRALARPDAARAVAAEVLAAGASRGSG